MAEMFLEGYTLTEIARHFGVTKRTVEVNIKKVRDVWKEESIGRYDDYVVTELMRINRVEREAWDAWRRSQKDSEKTVIRNTGVVLDKDNKVLGHGQETTEYREVQAGDPRYLKIIEDCGAERRRILGLYAPTKTVSAQLPLELMPPSYVARIAAGEPSHLVWQEFMREAQPLLQAASQMRDTGEAEVIALPDSVIIDQDVDDSEPDPAAG